MSEPPRRRVLLRWIAVLLAGFACGLALRTALREPSARVAEDTRAEVPR
jgi:hypothetical protein